MVSLGGGLLMLQECAGVKVGRTCIDWLVNCTWRVCSDSGWQIDVQSDLEMSHWLFNYAVSVQGDIGESGWACKNWALDEAE